MYLRHLISQLQVFIFHVSEMKGTVENVTAAYENVMENPYVGHHWTSDDGRFPVNMKRLVKKKRQERYWK